MSKGNETPLGTFRHGPYTAARMLVPLEAQAVKKLDEAAALLAEAAGLLTAAHQDEADGRTQFGGVGGPAENVGALAMRASGIAREGAAQLEGRRPPRGSM